MEGWNGDYYGGRDETPDEELVRQAEVVVENSKVLRKNIDSAASKFDVGVLSEIYEETHNPDFKWAADLRDAAMQPQSAIVSAVANPPPQAALPVDKDFLAGMEPATWRPYFDYLKQQQKPMPLQPKGMMELSILATQALRRGLEGKDIHGYALPEAIAACLQMEFRRTDEAYRGDATLAARAYDRDIIPTILIDRPKLYRYLASQTPENADRLLFELSQGIHDIFHYKYSGEDGHAENLYWTAGEKQSFIVSLESWQPSALEAEHRYPVQICGYKNKAYPDSLNILTCLQRWAQKRDPNYSYDILQPYREALFADRRQFRADQVAALAAPGTEIREPTLLDWMKPDAPRLDRPHDGR